MKIMIGGALGRMGRELAQAAEAAGVEVACGRSIQRTARGFSNCHRL